MTDPDTIAAPSGEQLAAIRERHRNNPCQGYSPGGNARQCWDDCATLLAALDEANAIIETEAPHPVIVENVWLADQIEERDKRIAELEADRNNLTANHDSLLQERDQLTDAVESAEAEVVKLKAALAGATDPATVQMPKRYAIWYEDSRNLL